MANAAPSIASVAAGLSKLELALSEHERSSPKVERTRVTRLTNPLPKTARVVAPLTTAEQALRVKPPEAGSETLDPSFGQRLECTLSSLGVSQPQLVLYGGHLPSGQLAPAEPLVCDPTSLRWWPLPSANDVSVYEEAGQRSSHASSVMGEARTLLVVCGGEGTGGELLNDVSAAR